jgi:hypothetical protein
MAEIRAMKKIKDSELIKSLDDAKKLEEEHIESADELDEEDQEFNREDKQLKKMFKKGY